MVPALSQKKANETLGYPSSFKALRSQTWCFAAKQHAMYSASTVKVATECCFLERQLMVQPASLKMYPDVDRRVSLHAA